MSEKNILFVTGSNNDIEKDGNPSQVVKKFISSVDKINNQSSFPLAQGISLNPSIAVCSADRTPEMLPSIINKYEPRGIIYHGGYALVLSAALQESLDFLRHEMNFTDPTNYMKEFFSENQNKRYLLPSMISRGFLSKVSYLHNDNHFIPTIGVPGKDTASQGLSALLSIAENPSGCEPRPSVGVNRVDTAVKAMYYMLSKQENIERIHILSDYRNISPSEKDANKKGAFAIAERLNDFGIPDYLVSVQNFTHNRSKKNVFSKSDLVIGVGQTRNGVSFVNFIDESKGIPFFINCHTKINMTSNNIWAKYLNDLSQVDNGVSVGVGNYDNAAILAAQIVGGTSVMEKVWEYRNNKTYKGIFKQPEWLKDGKIVLKKD